MRNIKWFVTTAISLLAVAVAIWGVLSQSHESPSQKAISQFGPAINNDNGNLTVNVGRSSLPARPIALVTGDYTICPPSRDIANANPRFLDFLYDVYTNRDKLLFLKVDVVVDCDSQYGGSRTTRFFRHATKTTVTYGFGIPQMSHDNSFNDKMSDAVSLDGPRSRDSGGARYMLGDNGTTVTILADTSGANQFTRLDLYNEGVEDDIYGPFLVKQDGEDGEIVLKLYPAPLIGDEWEQIKAIADRFEHS